MAYYLIIQGWCGIQITKELPDRGALLSYLKDSHLIGEKYDLNANKDQVLRIIEGTELVATRNEDKTINLYSKVLYDFEELRFKSKEETLKRECKKIP